MLEHFRLSHAVAGFVSVLVGYASSAVIVLQTAATAGATPAEQVSFLWVLGIGMGIARQLASEGASVAVADIKRMVGVAAAEAAVHDLRRVGRTEVHDGVEYVTFPMWEPVPPDSA